MNFATPNPFAAKPEPRTRDEWQVAADLSNLVLLLEQARRWNLIGADGKPNVELCQDYITRAGAQAIVPRNLGPAPGSPKRCCLAEETSATANELAERTWYPESDESSP